MSLELSTDLAHDPLLAATFNTLSKVRAGKRLAYHDGDKRKSVSWTMGRSSSAGSEGLSSDDPKNTRSSGKFKQKVKKKSTGRRKSSGVGAGTVAGSKSELLRRRSSTGSRSSSCWGKMCGCAWCQCDDEDSDMVEEWDDFTPRKIRGMGEDELLNRLEQATRALRPQRGNYDIEMEIQKWHRTLEMEQKIYEESGKPKFKYMWFRKNQYLTVTKLPLYSTTYENHRKLEVRLAEFKFGVTPALEEGQGGQLGHRKSYESTNSAHWRSDSQVFYANLALLCSASNFLRFPQACYANGGITFLLTYILMIAGVGQPLLYFEMVLGQYSLHGPAGFAKLHPWAKGIPYAIAFVCIVFGSSRSVYLAYSMLYSVISVVASPGKCGFWTEGMKCLAYELLEREEGLIRRERVEAQKILKENGTKPEEIVSIFSVELYFREVMLDSNWITGRDLTFVHWKLLAAYFLVCAFALIPMQYNISGRMMKRYLRYSIILPTLLLIVFLHQICARGAIFQTAQYIVEINTDHVSALSLWSEAFDMVLSTLGIGYGFHWFISGNISLDYGTTYLISWKICGCAALFGLLSSLVLFCEIGIVGELTGDDSHYHVFYERLGISFVCYSGALLKLGGNTVVFIFVFFILFIFYGMWSQIIVADIILRWIEHGHIIKGTTLNIVKRKKTTILLLLSIQMIVLSPYFFTKGGSVLASENIFGGALAAYVVVLAELITAVYLYGFARFLADLEIMIKRPLPTLFQIQIRYVVIPTIIIFLGPMMVNVYLFPSIYWERNSLGWLFYFGLLANFTPVLILLYFGQRSNICCCFGKKVTPTNTKSSSAPPPSNDILMMYATFQDQQYNPPHPHPPQKTGDTVPVSLQRYTIPEPTFISREGAPSQQGPSKTIRSEIYQVVENNMEYVHACQEYVKTQFSRLLTFKVNQSKWLKLLLPILRQKMKPRHSTFSSVALQVILLQKYRNDLVDIQFLHQVMSQMVNMTFFSAVRKLQRMPTHEMLAFLSDELLKLTTFRPEDYSYLNHPRGDVLSLSSSSSSSSSNGSSQDNLRKFMHPPPPGGEGEAGDWTMTIEDDPGKRRNPTKIQRRLAGYLDPTPEEIRTLLTLRLKRGLGLPHMEEMAVLTLLRRKRSKIERESNMLSMRDAPPIDHFVPSTVTNKRKEVVCFTIFHGVVVQGEDHFVLKRLPVPRPAIVKVTKSMVQSMPGKTLTDKFAHIISRRMQMGRNLGVIVKKRDLRDERVKRKMEGRGYFWRLAERVDDDVYDFLDRILTCVIVLVEEGEGQRKRMGREVGGKLMWLTPRTRRRKKVEVGGGEERGSDGGGGKRRHAIGMVDAKSSKVVTIQGKKERERERFLEGLRDAPDIRFHPDGEGDSEDSSLGIEEEYWNEEKSSSGSTSTLSGEEGEERLEMTRSAGRQTIGGVGVDVERGSFATVAWGEGGKEKVVDKLKSKYFIGGVETLQQRNERLLKKKEPYGILGLEAPVEEVPPKKKKVEEERERDGGLEVEVALGRVRREVEEVDVTVSTSKIRHISGRKWKHERDHPKRDKQREGEEKRLRFTEGEVKLMKRVDVEASKHAVQAVHSKSMEQIREKESRVAGGGGGDDDEEGAGGTQGVVKKALSLQSIRHLLQNSGNFKVGVSRGEIVAISKEKKDALRIEGKLRNENDDLLYISFGKTLIVDNGVRLSESKQIKGRLLGQRFAIGLTD